MSMTTITSKGQITIPKDIREKLQLGSGDKVSFVIGEDNKVFFLPATKPITSLRGIVLKPKKTVSLHQIKQTIKRKGGSK